MPRFHELMAKPADEPIPPGTVAELVERFLDRSQAHQAARTYEWYRDIIGQVYHQIKRLRAADLPPCHIHEILNANGWSAAYQGAIIRPIKRVSNGSIEQGYLNHSPIRGVRKLQVQPREQLFSPEESEPLLAHAPNDQFRDAARFVRYTGCRPREAVRIEARHLDEANGQIVLPPPRPRERESPASSTSYRKPWRS